MATRTPTIYATGKWILETPYQHNQRAIYVCISIRSLQELETNGVDTYERFYAPVGLSLSDYENDKLNLANIVTLASDTESLVEVPDTYILSFPDKTAMPYSHVVLSTSLGAVADSVSFSDVKKQIEELILNNLGITTTVNVHQAGYIKETVDLANHKVIERNRLSRMANNKTMLARNKEMSEELDSLREKNRLMEKILRDNDII